MESKFADLEPLGSRLIVKPDDQERVTKGGILLPDVAQREPLKGTVLASGPGRKNKDGDLEPTGLFAGERIVYLRYAGSDVEWNGETVKVLTPEDVLCRIRNEPRDTRGGARSTAAGG